MSVTPAGVELPSATLGSLAAAAGLPLEAFRREHVDSCIRRALEREGAPAPRALAAVLRADPAARARFRRSVAVSTTGLFRDPTQFDVLAKLLPPLLERRTGRIRIWSAGCADGTELASVALVLERLGALKRCFLLGSDLLDENIRQARSGTSLPTSLAGRLRWEQRDFVTGGLPRGRWDVVLCRNVAIYLTADAKRTLHAGLAAVLAAGGILLVGRSERIASSQSFGLEPAAPHAYRKRAA